MEDYVFVELKVSDIKEAQELGDDELLKNIIKNGSVIPFEWVDIARVETWSDILEGTVCFRLYYKEKEG